MEEELKLIRGTVYAGHYFHVGLVTALTDSCISNSFGDVHLSRFFCLMCDATLTHCLLAILGF